MTHSFHELHGINMYVRHKKLPEGFTEHKPGELSPFAPDEHVELMILTAQGLGSSGITRSGMHDWKRKKGGAIYGYRALRVTK